MVINLILPEERDTIAMGMALGSNLPAGFIAFFKGELGAGKTTFIRAMLQGLGFSGKVKSPTFTIVEEYELEKGPLFHFDFYRLSDPEELEYIGIFEYFRENAIVLIEWPEKGKGFLPNPDLILDFSVPDMPDKGRILAMESHSEKGDRILASINKNQSQKRR